MATALQMLPAIGARVFVNCELLRVECEVKDVKNSWGKPRLLIAPISGTGQQWVEMGRVTLPVTGNNRSTNLIWEQRA